MALFLSDSMMASNLSALFWIVALDVGGGAFIPGGGLQQVQTNILSRKTMATLAQVLPQPLNLPAVPDIHDDYTAHEPSQAVISRPVVPPYGQRKSWKPTSQDDYGMRNSSSSTYKAHFFLQVTVAPFRSAMLRSTRWIWARKRYVSLIYLVLLLLTALQASSGNTLALQVDSEGNVRYDAIAHQGQRAGKIVQSQFKDLVPLAHRKDVDDNDRSMERPSEEEIQETAERTKAALEKLVNGKIKAAQPKNVPDSTGKTSFIRYTPGQQNGAVGLKQRIIKMTEVVEDPLEPPRFKHKKIPRGPPSPPPPVLRSPPRKATAAEQKEWMIPPCISNWKNNKGFTIPLDKRLAADGRGLQDVCTMLIGIFNHC